ncbi:MAG: hypothetical protein WDN49_12310 [Acetobacteraceae bacterium]
MRFAVLILAGALMGAGAASAQEETIKLPAQDFSFDGPFGTFDRAAEQRGFRSTRKCVRTATL